MLTKLILLPPLIGIPLAVISCIFIGIIPYLVIWALLRNAFTEEIKYVAYNILRLSGALLGLLLSLTFVDVRADLTRLRNSIELEAAQIVDIYNDLGQFGTPEAETLQVKIVEYTQALINDEWAKLANDRFSPRAVELFKNLNYGVLNLNPLNKAQEMLQASIFQDLDEISDYRQVRHYYAKSDPPYFLFITVLGFLVTMSLLAVHQPRPVSILLMCFYCAFVGIVLYFIIAQSHPFDGAMRVTPEPFEVITRDVFNN